LELSLNANLANKIARVVVRKSGLNIDKCLGKRIRMFACDLFNARSTFGAENNSGRLGDIIDNYASIEFPLYIKLLFNLSGESANFISPRDARPVTQACPLTTTSQPSSSAIFFASDGVRAASPLGMPIFSPASRLFP
jgi:hypothetical protein